MQNFGYETWIFLIILILDWRQYYLPYDIIMSHQWVNRCTVLNAVQYVTWLMLNKYCSFFSSISLSFFFFHKYIFIFSIKNNLHWTSFPLLFRIIMWKEFLALSSWSKWLLENNFLRRKYKTYHINVCPSLNLQKLMGAIFTTLTQTPVNKEEYGDTDFYSVEISAFTMIQMLEMQLCRDYSNVSSQESVFDDIFKIRISKLCSPWFFHVKLIIPLKICHMWFPISSVSKSFCNVMKA